MIGWMPRAPPEICNENSKWCVRVQVMQLCRIWFNSFNFLRTELVTLSFMFPLKLWSLPFSVFYIIFKFHVSCHHWCLNLIISNSCLLIAFLNMKLPLVTLHKHCIWSLQQIWKVLSSSRLYDEQTNIKISSNYPGWHGANYSVQKGRFKSYSFWLLDMRCFFFFLVSLPYSFSHNSQASSPQTHLCPSNEFCVFIMLLLSGPSIVSGT